MAKVSPELMQAGRVEAREKWPAEVRVRGPKVSSIYLQLLSPTRGRVRIEIRSRKGGNFYVTARGCPVMNGKTREEAMMAFVRWTENIEAA